MNNFALNKRIENFKKRYNELLMELDNSSFLNISKFTDHNLMGFNRGDNITSLLEENDQVNQNLQIIKNSIKEKIKNLELLLEKSSRTSNIDSTEYIATFEEIIEQERNEIEETKSMALYRIYDDIERTISKIDRIKDYIEEKVLTKIQQTEKEKDDLNKALYEMQEKLTVLNGEKQLQKQIIDELTQSNNNLQAECDKAIDAWISLRDQLDNLHLLVDYNNEQSATVSKEKDELINMLETKINDLLFNQSKNTTNPDDNLNMYLSNFADILVDSIHKIFEILLDEYIKNESTYGIKAKTLKTNFKSLINAIAKINKNTKNSIFDIEEYNLMPTTDQHDEYKREIYNCISIKELQEYLNDLFNIKINFIRTNLEKIKDSITKIINDFSETLNVKSIKKINWISIEIDMYIEKLNMFNQIIDNFIFSLNDYLECELRANSINDQYISNIAIFLDLNIIALNNKLKTINSIKDIFYSYSFQDFSLIGQNDDQDDLDIDEILHSKNIIDTIDEEYEDNENGLLLDNSVSDLESSSNVQESLSNNDEFNIIEQNSNEIKEADNVILEQQIEDVENHKVDNDIELNDLNEFNEEFLLENNQENANNLISFEANVLQDNNENGKEINIKNSIFSNDDLTSVESNFETKIIENNKLEETNIIIDEITEYINENANTSLIDSNIIKLIEDRTQPIYDKISNIEIILNQLLNQKSEFSELNSEKNAETELLLEQKYNKNLKLRLLKTKLYHIKLKLEAELDNKYLGIIKQLGE